MSLRDAVYAGEIVRLPANDASRTLVALARAAAEAALGAPIREAASRMTPAAHFAAVTAARGVVASAVPEAFAVAEAIGLSPSEIALDRPRLRAIASDGHLVPAAAPAYFAHRDTWYANPRAQLNVWLALHDVTAEESFDVYPEAFTRPIANDSAAFDWDVFARDVGWQRSGAPASASYPRALEPLDALRAAPISAREAEIVVFSAAHLHRTRAQSTGRTRFSVDFRVVHLGDHEAGLGAPSVDDASRGSTLATYARQP